MGIIKNAQEAASVSHKSDQIPQQPEPVEPANDDDEYGDEYYEEEEEEEEDDAEAKRLAEEAKAKH